MDGIVCFIALAHGISQDDNAKALLEARDHKLINIVGSLSHFPTPQRSAIEIAS
jgi:hypothetical protein